MKTAILFSALAFSFMMVTIEANCYDRCKDRRCPRLPECKCGTYKDICGCCSLCLKCPGELCNIPASEMCANGTECIMILGADPFLEPGLCQHPLDTTPTPSSDYVTSRSDDLRPFPPVEFGFFLHFFLSFFLFNYLGK